MKFIKRYGTHSTFKLFAQVGPLTFMHQGQSVFIGAWNFGRIYNYGVWVRKAESIKHRFYELLRSLTPGMVYAAIDATDCDHCRVTYPLSFQSYREFMAWREAEYDNAEGPTFIWEITKEEYKEFERSERDLALEAFEDGHPHSIHR